MPQTPCFYQETRLSPLPASPSHVLHINTTGTTSTALGRKRAFDEISGVDEESYARKHLATEGSVFFRPETKSPRSFLWRVLNDRQLLEVQCVDLIHSDKSDCWLTYHITLPSPIIPGGVVLADGGEKDALEIFVITSAGSSKHELHTITLRGNLLLRETAPQDFDAKTCFRSFTPSCFSFRKPYRVVAVSSLELFVSLQDGGLMRLQRAASDSGANWKETYFSEGGWSGTLKGMLSLRNRKTVDYNGSKVEANAIAAIAASPDGKFVWTVSLDHMLKAWDTNTGKVVVFGDLLNEDVDLDEKKKQGNYTMGAEQGTLIQVVKPSMDDGFANADHFVVVHSPREHCFKFFGVTYTRHTEDGIIPELRDTLPRKRLIPPVDDLLNTNIWHLEQFHVQAGHNFQNSRIWLRARSGPVCKTFTMPFDLLDESGGVADIVENFQSAWSIVDSSSSSVDTLRNLPDFHGLEAPPESSTTPSEKWLEFLFFPGRFSDASLETALYIYRKGRNLPNISGKTLKTTVEPLKERITGAVSSKILLRRLPNEQPDYYGYQEDLRAQWATFFALLSHLHTRRHESVGSAVDPDSGLAWTVCADFVAPIRSSSSFELLYNNAGLLDNVQDLHRDIFKKVWPAQEDPLRSQLMAVAQQFRRFLSSAAQETLRTGAATNALCMNDETTAQEGLEDLYTRAGFANEITDDQFEALTSSAERFNGLGTVTDWTILSVLEYLDKDPSVTSPDTQYLGLYGKDVSIAITQEAVLRVQGVLLDLLALIIFMAYELDEAELSPEFHATEMYEATMLRLRETELRLWLVSNIREEPMKSGAKQNDTMSMTIYESIFIGDWRAKKGTQHSNLAALITSSSMSWAFGLPLRETWTDITNYVMANLLKHKEADLALGFVQFMTDKDSAWASYLKARVYLSTGVYALASAHFEDAVGDLAHSTDSRALSHGNLLSPDELNHFGQGPSAYFQHVLSLFEKFKIYSYTADFATRALQYMMSDEELSRSLDEVDMRKSKTDSPLPDQLQNAGKELKLVRLRANRDEILGRLFNALLQTGRFEEAYSTLTQMLNPILQKSNLQELLKNCVRRDAIPTLLDLPISGDLVHEADKILLHLARQAMASSALTSSASPAYHQILFAFRAQHADFRGAAAILYEHLERLRHNNGSKAYQKIQDPEDETLLKVFVLLINTLACCGEKEAWLLAEPIEGVHEEGKKRALVTLDDVRREYTNELDRRSDVHLGRFALVGGGDDDVDML